MLNVIAEAPQLPSYIGWLLPVVLIGVVIQFFWATIVTIVLYKFSKADRDVENLEERLHETTTKLVDERLRGVTHEVKSHAQQLTSAMDELKGRVKESDGALDGLNERDQKIELTVGKQIDGLKDYIRDTCASKGDVKDHERSVTTRMDRMGEKIEELGKEVAVLSSKVNT